MEQVLIPKADPKVIEGLAKEGIPLINPQKAIAERIRDNNHLREFLYAIEPVHRLNVYEALTPHLKFKPKAFWWLMFNKKKKRRQNAR